MSSCTTPGCDAVSILMTFAQLGQFLPQHWEMMSEKSAVGVSPYLLFFNTLYAYLAALDIFLLDAPARFSCSQSLYRCFIEDQPLIQMAGSAILCAGMWYWFLKYHHTTEQADAEERKLFENIFYSPSAAAFLKALIMASAISTAIAAALVFAYGFASPQVQSYAYFCGFLSAGLNAIMWIPQIFVTAAYGHKGALSINWVFLSIFMDITYSLYLASKGQHWTVWANNVPDGVQTFVLLLILLKIEYSERRRRRQDYHHYDPLRLEEADIANR